MGDSHASGPIGLHGDIRTRAQAKQKGNQQDTDCNFRGRHQKTSPLCLPRSTMRASAGVIVEIGFFAI
jgi:hypothetical protein